MPGAALSKKKKKKKCIYEKKKLLGPLSIHNYLTIMLTLESVLGCLPRFTIHVTLDKLLDLSEAFIDVFPSVKWEEHHLFCRVALLMKTNNKYERAHRVGPLWMLVLWQISKFFLLLEKAPAFSYNSLFPP